MSALQREQQTALPVKCATCERPLENPLFCTGCHTLRAADELNYFELFAMRPSYDLDPTDIRRAYLDLARVAHPDRFPGAAADVSGLSLRLSAQINRAYQVLLDPVLRAEYLLELAGGASAAQDKTVPQDVLTQTLMLREEIDEAKAAGDTATLDRCRREIQGGFDEKLARIAALAGGLAGDEALRRDLRHVLNTVKYYQRMLDQFEVTEQATGVR